MTKFKKMILLGTMILTVGATTVTAFAASSFTTPDGIQAASLDDIKAQRLELKKEILSERVEAGILTQEQADNMITQMEENQAVCDGTGSSRMGQMMGAGFGSGQNGNGQGLGQGQGCRGLGQGQAVDGNVNQ